MTKARWRNRKTKKIIRGCWTYMWSSDRFHVQLASKDTVTGEHRQMILSGDSPEWGPWRLVRKRAGGDQRTSGLR